MLNILCPCGAEQAYEQCCAQYIEHHNNAPTPEALMRSRYVAYTLRNMDYIVATMKGKALEKFKASSAQGGSDQVKWEKLSVLSTKLKTHRLGYVTFAARYTVKGLPGVLREKSEFQKIGEKWFYVNGRALKCT